MLKFLARLRHFFYYERVVLYGYDLTKHHDFESKTPYTLSKATLQDVEQLYYDKINTDLTSIKWDVWKQKISSGIWKGFILKDGDSIVAQAFYSIEDIFFGGTKWVVMTMPPKSAYGFKLYTRPDYRGKGLGKAITSFRLNNAKRESIQIFYTIIYGNNTVSRHNEEKIGGYLVGSIIFIKCRFFNWILLTPGIFRRRIKIKNIVNY